MRTAHKAWAGTFAATFLLVAAVQCSSSDTANIGNAAAAPPRPTLGPTGTVAVIDSPANVRLADGRAIHIPMLNMILGSHGTQETCERAADQRLAEDMLRGRPIRLATPRVTDTPSIVPAGYIQADVTVSGVDYASTFEDRAYAARDQACPEPVAPTYSDPAPSSNGDTDVDVDHDDTNHRDGAATGGFCRRHSWC